ncbi:LrgB family protein [Priestia megaterium]
MAVFIIVATVALYLVMAKVYVRFSYPILIPVLTTTIFVILLLLAFHVSYDEYMIGGKWINSLLGPAVVALAYPLYKQREMLVKYSVPIIGGVFVGLFAGMISGLVFAEVFGVDRSLILSIIPKSITTPVAIQIATGLGGVPSMTVVFVMIAGFSGVILGPILLKWIRIKSSLGKGIALGSASHALGTSKAFEYGELTVSMSSVSMTLSAVLGSVFGPIVVWLFQV